MGQHPSHTAVICGDMTVSYGALQAQVRSLASRICEVTKGRAVRVALCAERTPLGLVGILGILRAGAAYVPLDPHAPEPRQRQILEDADVALLVIQRHLRSHFVFDGRRVIELESVEAQDTQPAAALKLPKKIRRSRLRHLYLGIHRPAQRRGGDPSRPFVFACRPSSLLRGARYGVPADFSMGV